MQKILRIMPEMGEYRQPKKTKQSKTKQNNTNKQTKKKPNGEKKRQTSLGHLHKCCLQSDHKHKSIYEKEKGEK